jgi:NitT/TauT family transport system permease protein
MKGQTRAPIFAIALFLALWEGAVRYFALEPFVLPAPSLIAQTLVADWPILSQALWATLATSAKALALSVAGGAALAILFSESPLFGAALKPFAVFLQVTPIIAIAPLLLVWLEPETAVLVCAFLVAFFPILANMQTGLAATDRNLIDLFRLYGASRWTMLWRLKLPAAAPYFFAGLRIGGGLALVGAIVAELAAGASGKGAGLAFRIAEAGYRLNIPRMFAGLFLVAAAGLAIHMATSLAARMALARWHESERPQ